MLESLFLGWSNLIQLTVLVGMKFIFNVYLTIMVAKAVGSRTLHTAVMGAITVVSAALTILLLRQSGLGISASYAEFLLQVVVIAIAGYVVYTYPSSTRRIVTAVVFLGTVVLLIIMIPIYGEAFVAP
jgi:hypothetical protein